MKRSAASRPAAVALVLAALVAVLGVSALATPTHAASTVTFTCLTSAAALALIQANPPGSMSPDTSTCPSEFDGYYTPSTTTTTTATAVASNVVTGSGTLTSSATTTYTAMAGTPTCMASRTGTATIAGGITSNAPGVLTASSTIYSSCPNASYGTPSYPITLSLNSVSNYASVTIQLPSGQSLTGGLIVSVNLVGTLTAVTCTGAAAPVPQCTASGQTVTTSSTEGIGTLTGTGALAGATGTFNQVQTAITNTSTGVGSATAYYMFNLTI